MPNFSFEPDAVGDMDLLDKPHAPALKRSSFFRLVWKMNLLNTKIHSAQSSGDVFALAPYLHLVEMKRAELF